MHRRVQMQLEFAVVDPDRTRVEPDFADVELPLAAALRELEAPIGAAILLALDVHAGADKFQ